MSWAVASSAIVIVALLVGWLAYERSRPSARMTAVVATLAAVAALGRDAFVALPDVKPITAIALVVGYSLGPLPGFTVGAIGMLASNVMLGQGSYTPWQMAAWGLVGVIGAGLALLTRQQAGRLTIGLACAAGALIAKEIMNVYTWTLSGTQTLAAFLAFAGQAFPYDLTDTLASFGFGFAFGPALARLLARARGRMTVSWERGLPAGSVTVETGSGLSLADPPAVKTEPGSPARWPATLPLLVLVIVVTGAAVAATAIAAATARAGGGQSATARGVAYLEGAQNADGGFGAAPGARSSELFSAWAAIGLAAAGRDPLSLGRSGHTVLESIDAQAGTLEGAGDLERTILALRACGVSTRSLPGGDPVARLLRYRSADGSFGRLVNLTAFAILALRAAGQPARGPVVRGAARWLAHQQNRDGGFGYAARGTASDVDDTGAALQAVVAASVPDGPVVSAAAAYLADAQNGDGGYPQEPRGLSNAQSTAWAVQGLIAAGRLPSAIRRSGRSPLDYLRGLVAEDGSVRYSATSSQTPVWVTGETLAALAGKPLPVSAPAPTDGGETKSGAAPTAPAGNVASARGLGAGRAKARGVAAVRPSADAHARVDDLARGAGILIGLVLLPVEH